MSPAVLTCPEADQQAREDEERRKELHKRAFQVCQTKAER